jgi:hypothetical protein
MGHRMGHRWVWLMAWLACAATLRAQTITRVWPEQVCYRPGAAAVFTVTVTNPGPVAATVRVALVLRHGFDGVDELPVQTLELPVGQTAPVAFTWAVPADRKWGHEAVATLSTPQGTVLSTAREFFTVGANPWEVGHFISVFGLRGQQASGAIDKGLLPRWRAAYITAFEGYSWQPSVFDAMVPATAQWRSGQGGYREALVDWQHLIRQAHAQGLAAITYIQYYAYGPVGVEFARRHPEWLTFEANGRLREVWYDGAELADWRARPEEVDYGTPGGVTPGQFLANRPQVGQWWIDQVVKSAELMGWDGFRSDGMPGIVEGYTIAGEHVPADVVAANTAFLRQVREQLSARRPGYLFGFNNQAGDFPHPTGIPPPHQEVMLPGAYSLYESFRSAPDPRSPFHAWRDAVRHLQEEVRLVRQYGGFPHAGWMASHPYLEAIGSACGAQIDTWSNPQPYRRFEFRWSELLWDNQLRFARPGTAAVTVTAPPRVWWQDFVQQRELPDGRRRVIVHLINMPEKDDDAWADRPPEPAAGVSVAFAQLPGRALRQVVALSPETEGDIVPTTPGEAGAVGLPPIVRWTLVVAEYDRQEGAP